MTEPADDLAIEPLTAATWPALAELFAAGGDPKWCWCQFFRVRGLDWSNSSAEANRERLRGQMEAGPPPGLVAIRGSQAVGWVGLAPRADYERLSHAKVLAPVDDRPVWSIVCFVVARTERGGGIASALLEAAVGWAREQGATILEAYPSDTGGRRIPSANAYQGTLGMFERAGFAVVARRRHNARTPVRPIVRLEL